MPTKKTTKKPVKRIQKPTGDMITINGVGAGSAVAAGRNASAQIISGVSDDLIRKWTEGISKKIDKLIASLDEKSDLKQQVEKIGAEIQKGSKAEKSRLEKLINTLAVMSSDIFEVVVTTIQSPLAGAGLVLKKIGDKVKLEKRQN